MGISEASIFMLSLMNMEILYENSEVMGPDAVILVFSVMGCKPIFHSPLSLSSRGFPLHFLP